MPDFKWQVNSALCNLIKNYNFFNCEADQPFICYKRKLQKLFTVKRIQTVEQWTLQIRRTFVGGAKLVELFWKFVDIGILTGEADTIPEFQYNWMELWPPAFRFPANCNWTQPAPAPPPAQPQPAAQPLQQPDQLQEPQQPQPAPAEANKCVLRPKKSIDDKELSKSKCHSLRCKAQAIVTKLTPGAFSPKRGPPSVSASKQ